MQHQQKPLPRNDARRTVAQPELTKLQTCHIKTRYKRNQGNHPRDLQPANHKARIVSGGMFQPMVSHQEISRGWCYHMGIQGGCGRINGERWICSTVLCAVLVCDDGLLGLTSHVSLDPRQGSRENMQIINCTNYN